MAGIGDLVWDDVDGDGTFTAGELGIAGVAQAEVVLDQAPGEYVFRKP